MAEKEDLLMDTIQAKRNVMDCYQKLSDAVDEFEEKWMKKGVLGIRAIVDWRTKTHLKLSVDSIPDEMSEIIEDFKNTFNVELSEITEEKILPTSTRKFAFTRWTYEFAHVDRSKDL